MAVSAGAFLLAAMVTAVAIKPSGPTSRGRASS
jgi:hypothetical protein